MLVKKICVVFLLVFFCLPPSGFGESAPGRLMNEFDGGGIARTSPRLLKKSIARTDDILAAEGRRLAKHFNENSAYRKPDYRVTKKGTVLPTHKDYNLVDTRRPASDGGRWFQIHQSHKHGNLNTPHSHYPEKNKNAYDKACTHRRVRETTPADLDNADKSLRNGGMRVRQNRKDKGGPR